MLSWTALARDRVGRLRRTQLSKHTARRDRADNIMNEGDGLAEMLADGDAVTEGVFDAYTKHYQARAAVRA